MVKPRRLSRKYPAFTRHAYHQRLWALVEGAVIRPAEADLPTPLAPFFGPLDTEGSA